MTRTLDQRIPTPSQNLFLPTRLAPPAGAVAAGVRSFGHGKTSSPEKVLKYSVKVHNIRLHLRPAGVEPTTFGFGGQRSIQLSYERE